jgi:thiamine pyrophosphate-dependent acetolactate synthase large subunit-like protein
MAQGRVYRDGGEALLEAFRALGVDHVICSSGSEWAPVWEAFARQRASGATGPGYIDAWHETLAVDLAIGYTLKTGRMQAVLLHAAPGLLQGACGIHAANLAGLPMLVLSSDSDSYGERLGVDPGSQWYRNLSTVGGPHSLVDRYVKWSCEIPGVETLYEFVKRAGELSQRAPMGPAYLNAPVEVLLEPWTPPAHPLAVAPPGRKITPQDEIDALAQRLRTAEHPVILTETAGRDPEGFRALVRFAEAWAIPVVEPQSNVCGNFPKTHPLYAGNDIGALRESADLVLLINCRAPWYPPSHRPPNAHTVVIDETPQRPQAVYQVLFSEQYLEGEAADTLARAADLAPDADPAIEARRARAAEAHRALRTRLAKAEETSLAAPRLEAVAAIVRLREAVPDDAIFVDESITHSRLVQAHLEWDEPHRYFYVQGGLGQGIGVALGVKLAAGGRFVTLVLGDGAFLYNPVVQALALSRDQQLPILIVVLNNRRYLSMQLNHLRFYPDGVAQANDDFDGVRLDTQPPLDAFAEPYGMFGASVDDPQALAAAYAAAVAAVKGGRTAIVNVLVNR